jgi:hypothetical protein
MPNPNFRYEGARACGDLLVFTADDTRTEQLVIEFDRNRAQQSIGSERSFDVGSALLRVRVEMYERNPGGTYCTDVLSSQGPPSPVIWVGISGKAAVKLSVASDHQPWEPADTSDVEIRFDQLVLRNPAGRILTAGPFVIKSRCCWHGP